MVKELNGLVRSLETNGQFLVGIGEDMREGSCASDETIKRWGDILAQYRQLTMAVTASSLVSVRAQAIQVYEDAADACLLGGNLSFYVSCQSRLLRELYSARHRHLPAQSRYSEFLSYSFLYFGVFHVDHFELAHLMRGAPPDLLDDARFRLAFAAMDAVQKEKGVEFIRIYRMADARQRTLMNPKLPLMRKGAMGELVCAYHNLDKKFALTVLGFSSEAEFLELLRTQKPALAKENSSASSEFRFRVPTRRNAVAPS